MKFFTQVIVYIISASLFTSFAHADEELNVYSARNEAYIKPLLDQFANQHTIKINLVTDKADTLIERLRKEGKNTPADVLITTDAGRLYRAQQADLFQPISDPEISKLVPTQYQDPAGLWVGLSVRARVIVYHDQRVSTEDLSSYEDLADPKWRNRICVRSSNNIYNQSLLASMIAHTSMEETLAWAKAFVANFARKPQGGDRDQIKAIAAGQCDIAVVNSYYYGNMINGTDEEKAAVEHVHLFWPNQDSRGTHVNISGIGIIKYANNKQLANQLIKFLLSTEAQQWYGDINLEYPVIDDVELNPLLQSWGNFKADTLALNKLGELNSNAVILMDRAKWR
jgi:iron(III) transport system substrate-binding protein